MVNSYNDKSPHPFWFFLFFSSRWSFGLEKEKKGRTPKSPARNKKYSYVLIGEMYIKKFTKRKKRATFAAVNGIMIYEL